MYWVNLLTYLLNKNTKKKKKKFLNRTWAIINSTYNIYIYIYIFYLKIVYIHFVVLWLISRTSIQFHIVLYVKSIILFFVFGDSISYCSPSFLWYTNILPLAFSVKFQFSCTSRETNSCFPKKKTYF